MADQPDDGEVRWCKEVDPTDPSARARVEGFEGSVLIAYSRDAGFGQRRIHLRRTFIRDTPQLIETLATLELASAGDPPEWIELK